MGSDIFAVAMDSRVLISKKSEGASAQQHSCFSLPLGVLFGNRVGFICSLWTWVHSDYLMERIHSNGLIVWQANKNMILSGHRE